MSAPNCPKCNGPMWDNRESKTKPTQPDYKCKNRECDGALWPVGDVQPPTRQLQTQGAGESATQSGPVLDFSQIGPEIMSRAAAIAADVMANGGTINPAQALAAAYHFEQTGEVIGRHAYVGTSGQVSGKVLEGYRGVTRELDMSRYQYRYRPLTADEQQCHEIEPTWQTLACECDVLHARAQCIRMGIPYAPVVGIGIVKPADKLTAQGKPKDPPKTKTWYWVLQKRARVDALRQLGENTSAEDVLEEAGLTAPEGYITIEQAEALVRERARAEQRITLTPPQQQAQLEANILAMRGPVTDDPLGVDTHTVSTPPITPAAAIKARLLELVADKEWKIEPASAEQVKKINTCWAVLIPDTRTRRAVREYLLDHDSSAYTRGEIASLLTFFDMQRDGEGALIPGAQAIADAKTLTAFLFPPEPGLFEDAAAGK
jgi:hypothetical protein